MNRKYFDLMCIRCGHLRWMVDAFGDNIMACSAKKINGVPKPLSEIEICPKEVDEQ